MGSAAHLASGCLCPCCLSFQEELAARAARYGSNVVRPPREVTFMELVAEALQVRGLLRATPCSLLAAAAGQSACTLLAAVHASPARTLLHRGREPSRSAAAPLAPAAPAPVQDFTILVLLGAGCLSLALELLINRNQEGGWIEGASILAAGAGAGRVQALRRVQDGSLCTSVRVALLNTQLLDVPNASRPGCGTAACPLSKSTARSVRGGARHRGEQLPEGAAVPHAAGRDHRRQGGPGAGAGAGGWVLDIRIGLRLGWRWPSG